MENEDFNKGPEFNENLPADNQRVGDIDDELEEDYIQGYDDGEDKLDNDED